jgi:hypothetical protein
MLRFRRWFTKSAAPLHGAGDPAASGRLACALLATLVALLPLRAAALSLGSAELKAASALGCVLADDALGYLTEDEFNRRFDTVVEGFDDAAVDVIYAKALGYIDGLLFGVGAGDASRAMHRLEDLSSSDACRSPVRYSVAL